MSIQSRKTRTECERFPLDTVFGVKSVHIARKPVRALRLRVSMDGTLRLSAPVRMPEREIRLFVGKNLPWIEKQLRKFAGQKPVRIETDIRDGGKVRILGRDLIVRVIQGPLRKIEADGFELRIFSPWAGNPAILRRQYEQWRLARAQSLFQERLDALYPIVADRNVPKPGLRVRIMRTRWGSCGRRTGRINLNSQLLKVPVACIDYVILHELVHFLHPYHDRTFYAFLGACLPDFSEREHELNQETVLGF